MLFCSLLLFFPYSQRSNVITFNEEEENTDNQDISNCKHRKKVECAITTEKLSSKPINIKCHKAEKEEDGIKEKEGWFAQIF